MEIKAVCSKGKNVIFTAFAFAIGMGSVLPYASADLSLLKPAHSKPFATEGKPFEFVCRSKIPIKDCSITTGGRKVVHLSDGLKNELFEYSGGGLADGYCGIKFFSAKTNQEGNWTCRVTYLDGSSRNMTLWIAVDKPADLVRIKSNKDDNKFMENDTMIIHCEAIGGLPAIYNYKAWLGTQELGSVLNAQTAVFRVDRITREDCNKNFYCSAENRALSQPINSLKYTVCFIGDPILVNSSMTCALGLPCTVSLAYKKSPDPIECKLIDENGKHCPECTKVDRVTDGSKACVTRSIEFKIPATSEQHLAMRIACFSDQKEVLSQHIQLQKGGTNPWIWLLAVCSIIGVLGLLTFVILKLRRSNCSCLVGERN